MVKFVGSYLTDGGLELINNSGVNRVVFTKAVSGSGVYVSGEDVHGLSALKVQEQVFDLEALSEGVENTVGIKFKITNTGLEHDYNLSEVGVYAKADGGEELLYCVAYALEGDTEVIPVPDGSTPYIISVEVDTVVSRDAAVSVVYSEERRWTIAYVGERIDDVAGRIPTRAADIGALASDGDSKDNSVSFTSGDGSSATAWSNVGTLASGEKHSSIFNKISTMFKNVRYLYNNVGAIKGIVESLSDCNAVTQNGYAASAKAVRELNGNLNLKVDKSNFHGLEKMAFVEGESFAKVFDNNAGCQFNIIHVKNQNSTDDYAPTLLYSNQYYGFQMTLESYAFQIAFSFGSDRIAIRRRLMSQTWTDWKYFSAS